MFNFEKSGCGNDGQFRDFCERLSLVGLPENPKFLKNELRVKHRKELVDIIEHVMVQKTNKEWTEMLNGAKFPYGPVNEMKEVFDDPQVLHNDMLQTMEHPILGQIKQVSFLTCKKKCLKTKRNIESFEIELFTNM